MKKESEPEPEPEPESPFLMKEPILNDGIVP